MDVSRDRGPRRLRVVAIAAAAAIALAVVAHLAYRASGRAQPVASAPSAAAPAAVPAQYVGSSACADCHRNEYSAWRGSHHDLAMQVADGKTVLGNFDNATFKYAGSTSKFFRRDGRFLVNTDGPDGKPADYEIKYTFGVTPLQQYLIELPGGRLQALGIAWDSRPKGEGGGRWFHLYPGRGIKAGDPLHWTGIDQNWNYQCAECHSTNLRKNFDARTGTFGTTWTELNVACEACHGPGSSHAAWAKAGGTAKGASGGDKGLAIALDERRGVAWTPVAATGNAQRSAARGSSREVDMCARCHGRAGRFADDYAHGKSPLDTHRPAGLDEPLFYVDGQMRDEVYNWAPFAQSRMYAKGVTCSDCHDPHTQKLRAGGNAVCAQCHQPAKFDDPTHTHHAAGTPGAACTACHMPTTTYMVIDPRHDHSMRIPRPDLSVKLGVPNACNRCHAGQSSQWAADAVTRWTGKIPVGYQNFAEAYRAGAEGAPGGRGALLAIIDDSSQPAIVRAGAIERLGRWLTPSTLGPLTRGLNDPDPLVRSAAVQALGAADPAVRQRYLPRMLDDPVRVVRIDAARALAGPAEAGLAPRERSAFDRALAEYVAAQTHNADRPEAHVNLGNLYRERNRAEDAIAEYRKAVELDPTFVAGYANLADVLRARGAEDEAASTLRQGLARNPNSAPLRHALGLTLVRQRRSAEALAELAAAAREEPGSARYAYVLAVALNDAGKPKESLRALARALERNPYDRDLVSGMAIYSDKAGDRATAATYARLLRELEPENPNAASLSARILEHRSP